MKRYNKYKPSGIEWIGDIPEHWKTKRLKHLLREKITDGPHETPEFVSDGIPFLSVDSIKDGEIIFENTRKISEVEHVRFQQKCKIERNDILMGKAASVGKIARVKVDFEFSIWSPLALLKAKTDLITSEFLEYYLKSEYSQAEIILLSSFNTQRNISMADIPKLNIVLPRIDEQKLISLYLDQKLAELKKIIENKSKLISFYDEEKQAIINQAVTKGLDPNVKLKDSGVEWLGEIPEHWEVKKLKYLSIINPTKDISKEKDLSESVVFLPMEKVKETGIIDCEIKKPISTLLNGFTFFRKNDVIVAKITPCFENGKGALLDKLETEFGFGSTEFHVLRANEKIKDAFLYLITKSEIFMKIGEAFMTGAAGQKRVPTDFISEFIIGFPQIDEQQSIVTHIEKECTRLDTIIEKFNKQIELLQEYRTTLISEVVTGKIKVS